MDNESKKKGVRAPTTELRYDVHLTIDVALERGIVADPRDLEIVLEEALAAIVDDAEHLLVDAKKPRLRLRLVDSTGYDVRFVERVKGGDDGDGELLHHAGLR